MKKSYKIPLFTLCIAVSLYVATSGVRAEDAPKGLSGAGSSVVCKLSPSAADKAQKKKSIVICDYRHGVSFRPSQLTLEVARKK